MKHIKLFEDYSTDLAADSKKSKIKNPNPKQILIVGDSQSAVENEKGGKITYTYPNVLREKLKSEGTTLDVLAIGGKTTDWMKNNLPEKLKGKRYDRVIIYGGGNDTSNASIKLETTLSNIQEMVDMSNQNGADVFVNLGYKIEGTAGKFGNHKIMGLTKYLKTQEDWIPYVEKRKKLQQSIPTSIKNAMFIPVYDLQQNTNDGIHPNQAGHKIVADNIYDSIVKKY
jgi:lysophospholipase L1-like esterase